MNDEILSTARSGDNSGEDSGRSPIGSPEATSRQTIAVAGTFTADLLTSPLQFWMEQLEISAKIVQAPYAQLIQELLNPQSLLSSNQHGVNVLLVRLEDWIRDRIDAGTQENLSHLHAIARDFARAVELLRTRIRTPLLIHFCPASAALSDAYRAAIDDHENELVGRLHALPYTHCSTHAHLMRLYPVVVYENPQADRIAHIPYTQEYFAAIATLAARRIAALMKPQYKVIALDCDNTLWQGICGEDGATGVNLTPAHLEFQRMLVRQHDAGMLLCICSKNNPADVEAVFRARSEMPLREEHLICSRINWKPKSENLRSLARELDLGLDGFILIDDSGLECAEVQANCPPVLTLQMPQTEDELLHFIDHVWAFDRLVVTQDAKQRTAQYRQNQVRSKALREASDLRQFLTSLELQVDIASLESTDLPRVAELVQRTNQFNLTTIRRRASDIEALCASAQMQCLVVRVRDRFGDYGLVGALLFRWTASDLDVDTFVLSCRVLGREVEHRIVNELGRRALDAHRDTITLKYRRTARNAPAWTFLENSFGRFRDPVQVQSADGEEIVFRIPSGYALRLARESSEMETREEKVTRDDASPSQAKACSKWHESAYRFSRLPELMAQLSRSAVTTPARHGEGGVPQTSTEIAVAQIWTNVLGVSEVGLQDDFFDLGGDSLLAVQVIANIGSVLGLELSIYEFFEAPTVQEVARKLAQSDPSEEGVHVLRSDGPAPLSSAQQRLWFIDRLDRGSAAYHIPLALRLRGELRSEALLSALNGVVSRHAVLRSVFVEIDGEPIQRTLPRLELNLQQVDLSGQNDATVLERLSRDAAVPFDLSTGPLIRAELLRVDTDEYVLLITLHHIVSDGWSLGVLMREFDALYGACISGQSDPLPALPIQYADYAVWQRQRLLEPQIQTQLKYWNDHLRGAPALIDLPTDRLRPATQSYRGGNVPVVLGPELTGELKALARQLNVTLAMTLYTAWSIVLMRLSGQDDVVIGMPVAGRRRTEFEPLIGFFVNTLAVRVRCEDDPTIHELLARVRDIMLGAQANQDVPFELVVEALQPVRTLSFSPVFQVTLAFHNAPARPLELAGLIASVVDVPVQTAQFDLSLSLQESAEGVGGVLNYASDLFDDVTIRRWVEHFTSVLKGMTRSPDEKASVIPLLGDDEYRQVIDAFNETHAPYPRDQLLHRLFEKQVQLTPDATAVVHEAQSLTYAQLNSQANQLARCLRSRGVGPDELVGLCADRSVEMLIGILGIWKAGGAYVPLDPQYPGERLARMLEDSAPKVLLTQERLRERLPLTDVEMMSLDECEEIGGEDDTNLDSAAAESAHQLAYVIYTSGSTGIPKGVMIEHGSVLNLWQGLEPLYGGAGCERVALNASFNFDASVQQFVQLLSGRTLYVVGQERRRDAERLLRFVEEHGIHGIDCTPSQLKSWVSAGLLERAGPLRVVLVGGEAIDAELWGELSRCAGIEFYNVYGPTECTVDATMAPLRGDRSAPHIGRPMPNRRVLILDRQGQPVPIGVAGEIFIGGVGLARGYLNRAELTQERFIHDPFSVDRQARMYRTGDLGRWRADGMIEYLGRNDQQVKIRGFRIELGEIELQLLNHERVRECVVMAREDVPGEKRLVAYVCGGEDGAPGVDEMRAHLKKTLPEYMVPTAFVLLERFPITPNGKLDQGALPVPQLGVYASQQYEAPIGEAEEILAGIWQSLLGVERVGRQDNFFELGGHSLLIVQLMERLRRVGLSAEVRQVFDHPTLAEFTQVLTHRAEETFVAPPNRILPGCTAIEPQMLPLAQLEPEHIERIVQSVPGGAANVQDIYPLVALQEGILFHHLLDERRGDTYIVSILLLVSSRERTDELIAALQAMIDRHDVLRTAVLWEGLPQPLQVVYRRATLPVKEVTLHVDRDPMSQVSSWFESQQQRLDVREAPLMRLQLAADPHSQQYYALLQFHHIVVDHVTQEAVTAEVVAHLEGDVQQLPVSVPYRNHVAQSLDYARRHDADAFFRRKLADIVEPTAPFGLLDVHADGTNVDEANQLIESSLAARIRVQARSLGVTPATLFHAGWGLVVAHTSAREDVVFGSLLLGRLQGSAGAQRILGVFINTLPLRLRLEGVTARALVEQAHRELVELLHYEQASLAAAQRCSGIVGTAPLFTALLNYRHSVADVETQWSARGIKVLAVQERTNYPITMSVDDLGQGFALTALTDRRMDAQRVTGYLHEAMRSLVQALEQAPHAPALSLPILPDPERRQVTETFNATRVPYPQEKLIHQLFEDQVERMPESVALVYEDATLSYAELNGRANQLARHLRTLGVGPDRPVAICVERGVQLVIGLLATLKAGGAYVPLDPKYPMQRLEHMLQDSQPQVLLTQQHLCSKLPATGAQVVTLDSVEDELSGDNSQNLEITRLGLRSHHLAYVIYTSGSTGLPKGVMIEHAAVVNFLFSMKRRPGIVATDCMLAVTTVSFDIAALEIYLPLITGAKLVLASREDALDANRLMALMARHDVTVMQATPATWRLLLGAGWMGRPSMKALCGGEALTTELAQSLLSSVQSLWNLYGPTETTIWSCARQVSLPDHGAIEPVGQPIANTQVFILNNLYQPVPLGCAGEIYIGGAGVARGYLNRRELTAQRFIVDPFGDVPNARLYRTGDVGRWRADGAIEYLGRNDHQVKVRGYRIELGEIDAQLLQHEQVKEAAVIAREDVPGDQRLVAYVVARSTEQAPTVEALHAHLRSRLPEHMMPGAFVTLEHLPQTPNGKLDRRALPAPDQGAYTSREYEPPCGDVEEILAGIWQSLLRAERVGRQDNFFELGGHSLLIVQMMERLRRVGLAVEVRRVFDSPTLADLASVLTNEVVEQFEVPPNLIPPGSATIEPQMLPLAGLEPEYISKIVASVPGGAANVQDIYPLAPLQEGILFHHLLNEQGADSYVLTFVLCVSSRHHLDEFLTALQAVIDRHDVLRTAVLWEDLPRPMQVVCRTARLPIHKVKLDADREPMDQIRDWLRPERQRLNLRQAPLMSVQVAEHPNSGEWYVLWQLHHIVDDATSLRLVISEIVAHLQGRSNELPEPLPYRNHVAQSLAYARKHDAEEFFRSRLADVVEPTAPFGLLDVHSDGSNILEAREVLDAETARRARSGARRLGVSAATLFHAAWALVVAHTSGRDDIVFGSVLLGRLLGSAGAQKTIGMFINTLPLRLRLEGVTARALIEQTQRELVELLGHEQASLAAAQRCSGIEGSAPLFTALLNYRHHLADSEANWPASTGIRIVAEQQRTNYPVTLSVDDMGEDFALTAWTDQRIDPHRVTGYLRTALNSLVQALEHAPHMPALSLKILPEVERRHLIEVLNTTQAPYGRDRRVHELFEDQVRRTPDAVAVVYASQSLSYAELNRHANQLARYLRWQGAANDVLVGICMERSLEMIVGLLGILKAGGAYLPLDPNYPSERLQYMLQDAAPAVVLIQERLRASLPPTSAAVIALDTAGETIGHLDAENLDSRELGLTPSDLAYVIYTSGSTGRPKGTAMSHGAMVNLLEWHRTDERLAKARRVLQFAALSFDVAFQETFSTLCTGGTLVLLDEWVRKDARALIGLLKEQSVERLFLPPLMLQSLAEYCNDPAAELASLRDVVTAGEQLRITPEIEKLFSRLSSCRLHNHYGPTETHVVTALQLTDVPSQWPLLPSIGRPIANTQIYILDEHGQPVPMGVAGDIYIGGANLARGYLSRAALTADRFVADPFNVDQHGRLYKTGDLGRWQSDGTIEYLGRNDDQVKIRGFRIELGEIEAQLSLHEQVKDAVVVARDDAPGHRRLVAYITPRDRSFPPGTEDLRAHLKNAVPEHMVPGAFVTLDTLPLTSTGKLNRRALPAPELDAYVSRAYEPPQGDMENALAGIWQSVLRVDRVGRHDNFFDLGGHSLRVLNVLFRINRAFSVELRVTDVYNSPTLSELAQLVSAGVADDEFVNLQQEGHLPEDIVASPGALRTPAKTILLTGATGFVGRFLLAQLLEDTDATICCLIRGKSQEQAAARLRTTLEKWDLWKDEAANRIVVLAGDLRLPRFGIDDSTYRMLGKSVDTIYHCGASMNHLETYTMAKQANVDAARQLVRLATEERPKLINYISTQGVFSPIPSQTGRVVDELSPIEYETHRHSQGYVASKWVGEKIFLTASERGIPGNIFRLGLIWADSQRGRYDDLQREHRIIKSCLLSGYGIREYRYDTTPAPVDYAARAVVFLASKHSQGHGIFHISGSERASEPLFERCNELPGVSLELVSLYDWIRQIRRLHLAGQSLPVVPLIQFAFAMNEHSFGEYQQRQRAAAIHIDSARTRSELEQAGIRAPELNDRLLAACIESLRLRDAEVSGVLDVDGAVVEAAHARKQRSAGRAAL